MRAEGIGQGNRFAAIGTYGNDFAFIGLKCPDNTNRTVYQLKQPTDNRSITSKQGSRVDVICIDSPVSIFGINLHSIQHIHLQLSPAERTVGDRFGFLSPDCHIYLDEMFKAGAAILADTVDDNDLVDNRASVR